MSKPLVITSNSENYFNLTDNEIHLKIPLPNNNFSRKEAYYLGKFGKRKAILVHITDGTENSVCGDSDTSNALNTVIKFSEVNVDIIGKKLKLKKNDKLYVYIVNDTTIDFLKNQERIKSKLFKMFLKGDHNWGCDDIYLKSEKAFYNKDFRPKEAGGGIIVEGP
ncbi:hypothetical protein [uncultured Polaribacter sp.]|uniref:hypothetical protein n=1 Tax=uncultured Polaribacter sp. TaxID=174711 RepID=UPI0026022B09|nr:hypothetical protein [uncultured Polaribacter sp.]